MAVLWVLAPDLYEPGVDGRLQAIALTRTGILTAGAALLALVGVLANLLENRRATNLTHDRELDEQAETRRVNDLTHTRELYARAVDQLGSDTLDIRLGGIYALERLAWHSTPDRPTIVEVLSAFVREHTIPGRPGAVRRGRRTALPTPAERVGSTAAPSPGGLDTDIQAALTVLGRLPTRTEVPHLDRAAAQLAGAWLDGANLTSAGLDGADLSGARLGGANLFGAWLYGANLSGTRLNKADLSGTRLGGANLTRARLDGADLTGTRLYGADLSGAQLVGANLTYAGLGEGANLTDAGLRGANLTSADLTGAKGLTQAQLDAAYGDGTTKLPVELARPAHWPEKAPRS